MTDDTSHQAPGKRETIVRSDGQKKTIQRWHLSMNISEVYELFKMEYPNAAVGKSKFASLRPEHYFNQVRYLEMFVFVKSMKTSV